MIPLAVESIRGSVVVLNWNGRELLDRCLPPLFQSIDIAGGAWTVVVVDNGSTDGSVDHIRATFPDVELISNPTNLGFSAAANQGIRRARGELVAMLNNDVVVTPIWLKELTQVLSEDASLGSVAAQMRYLDSPDIINSAGIEIDIVGRAYDRHDGSVAATEPPAAPERVFGASAGAALYRRAVLEHLGGFDERFFAYLEDVDLAWRLQRIGYGCAHVPSALVLHEHSATSGRVAGMKTYLSVRNHWWLLAKNASTAHLVVAAPLVLALALWTTIIALVEVHDPAGLRGLRDALRGWPAMRRSRGEGAALSLWRFAPPRVGRYRRAERARLRR